MTTAPASASCASATLNEHFPISGEQTHAYLRDGSILLREVLDADTINTYAPTLTALVTKGAEHYQPIEQRDTYGKAFLQVGNLWEQNALAREFVFGQRLARIAADLMATRGVRMYHDQALDKEPDGGFTPWHADQQYWPLSTDKCVTAWIPLQDIPLDMGPLEFSIGSQHILDGRDLVISDDSETTMGRNLKHLPKRVEPFTLGDVSFHSGWCFHRAGPNTTQNYRRVMTIIFMDIDMIMKKPENPRQANGAKRWCPGVEPGDIINSPRNPIIWERT